MQLLKTRLKDAVTHHRGLRNGRALLQYVTGSLRGAPLSRLQAYQAADSRWLEAWCHPQREPGDSRPLLADNLLMPLLERYRQIYDGDPLLSRSLILKSPGPDGEKGVIYVAFEYNLYRLLHGMPQPRAFLEMYDVILATSWSPTSYALLEWALHRIPGTLYLEASNPAEIPKLEAYHPRIKCVSTMPCNWIHPGFYEPKPHAARHHDLLMVANWAPFKRHFELFTALARMPAGLKIALVGQKEAGRTSQEVLEMARHLGSRQQLDIYESIPIQQVRELQCNSKAAVLMSRREGSCVAAVEALFANTPLGMRADAHVGSRKYVNEHTGRLFHPHRGMHHELMALLDAAPHMQPRQWAESHLSCHQAIRCLNEELQHHARSLGRPWTRDVSPMCWNPYPTYINPEDLERFTPEYDALHRAHPAVFPTHLAPRTSADPRKASPTAV